MDVFEAIHTRRSIRKFEDRSVSEDLIQQLLSAAMDAPSARNAQPWQFVVIHDHRVLREVARINPNAAMAEQAPLGILICGDMMREKSAGYWVIDCAAATQNMLLAAHALGLGAVWTGVYPREERIEALRQLLHLPEEIVPHSLVLLGHAAEEAPPTQNRYRADRVHVNQW